MKIEAAIFDMDGVIINSEPLWEKAEKEAFASVGIKTTSKLSKLTKSMTTAEVTQFWYNIKPWTNKTLFEVENEVIDYVEFLVKKEGTAIIGIHQILRKLKANGIKLGLATNSPYRLISVVLKKLNIENYFDVVSSAEHEIKGKPDPAIYFTVARKLKTKPEYCIVFEDSLTGILAAKATGMKTIALLSENEIHCKKFKIADLIIRKFSDFKTKP